MLRTTVVLFHLCASLAIAAPLLQERFETDVAGLRERGWRVSPTAELVAEGARAATPPQVPPCLGHGLKTAESTRGQQGERR